MQHDPNMPEDLDANLEDDAVDQVRYACMSQSYPVQEPDLRVDAARRQLVMPACLTRRENARLPNLRHRLALSRDTNLSDRQCGSRLS